MLDERLRIDDPTAYSERRYQYLVKFNIGRKIRRFWRRGEEFQKTGSSVAHVTIPFAIKDEQALAQLEDMIKKGRRGGGDILIESFSFFSE